MVQNTKQHGRGLTSSAGGPFSATLQDLLLEQTAALSVLLVALLAELADVCDEAVGTGGLSWSGRWGRRRRHFGSYASAGGGRRARWGKWAAVGYPRAVEDKITGVFEVQ